MNRRMLITTNQALFSGDDCPIELPTFGGSMFAAYLLGTDYWDGTSFTTVKDGSGQGRDLVLTGSMGAKALAAPGNFATLPFTGDDLCAAHGACTLVTVSQIAPDVTGHFFGGYSSVAARYMSLFASSTYALQALEKDGTASVTVNDPDSDGLRAGFEFMAMTSAQDGVSLWRSKNGAGLRRAATSSTTLPTIGGDRPILIGKGSNGPAPTGNHAFAAAFNKALSSTEMQALFAKVTLLLAGGGTAVAH